MLNAVIGLGTISSVSAQANENYAISCHGCNDATKKSTLEVHLNSGFPAGNYNFFVVDMGNRNIREYEVNVPQQNAEKFGQSSQPATVTLKYRSDQAHLNKSVADVKDSLKLELLASNLQVGISGVASVSLSFGPKKDNGY